MHHLKKKQTSCLIVGGGIAGLIIAKTLQRNGIVATVIDKGRGIGGRLATRRIHNHKLDTDDKYGVFDYGAQYFSVQNPKFQTWVNEWLAAGIITEWSQGFNNTDHVYPRYRGVVSNRAIAKYMAQDLDIHTSTKVKQVTYQDNQWLVSTEQGQEFTGDFLAITAPVPQALELLANSAIAIPPETQTLLQQVNYHPCIALLALLNQPSTIPAPGGIFAEQEPLAWLADNQQKNISPEPAITLHGTTSFSSEYWDADDQAIAEIMLSAASNWIKPDSVIEYQIHRWRYSLVKTTYPENYCYFPKLPLIIAGDGFVAPKIEGAALSAIAASQYIRGYLLRYSKFLNFPNSLKAFLIVIGKIKSI